jgi:O-antigen/teichoic acid export membrane protein
MNNMGLFGALYGLLIARIVTFIVGIVLIIFDGIKFVAPSMALLKAYMKFSLPLVPFVLSAWVITLCDRYIIGFFLGIGAVGVYSAAYNLGNIIKSFIGPLWMVLLPAVAHLYENQQIVELKNHLKYSFKFFLLFAIPAFIGLSVLARPILTSFTTIEFAAGFLIVPVIAFATLFWAASTIMGNTLMLSKKTLTITMIYTCSALINIILNFVLVPVMGMMGAAIATFITFMLHFIVMSKISLKELSFEIDLVFILKSILSAAIMGIVIYFMRPTGIAFIIISICVGIVIYFGVLLLVQGFTKKELHFFMGIARSFFKFQ